MALSNKIAKFRNLLFNLNSVLFKALNVKWFMAKTLLNVTRKADKLWEKAKGNVLKT